MQTKKLHNLHIYIDADYKKMSFHVCAYILRQQVLIC